MKLSLLDKVSLRTSAVYKKPAAIFPLQIVYGDHGTSPIPCRALDGAGTVFHISDRPMALISKVYVAGEPASGFKAYPSWQDETGRAIACVIFDHPQYDKAITVNGKGSIDESGNLIENPADLIQDFFLSVQGYDPESIDAGAFAAFYSDCLKEELKLRTVLADDTVTVKDLLDEIALNIHAHWIISDGRSIMKLRGLPASDPIRYRFAGSNIREVEITSEDLINEITVNFARDYSGNSLLASVTKYNKISQAIYGRSPESYDFGMLGTVRIAESVIDRILRTFSFPQLITSFKHDVRSLFLDPGDVVSITHAAGPGDNGFLDAPGLVRSQALNGSEIDYTVVMDPSDQFYSSELLNLSQCATSTQGGLTVSYQNGVATLTIYADVQGSPPIEGAEVTISSVKKITDKSGQVRFNLLPGTYTAQITASGYEDAEITFTV